MAQKYHKTDMTSYVSPARHAYPYPEHAPAGNPPRSLPIMHHQHHHQHQQPQMPQQRGYKRAYGEEFQNDIPLHAYHYRHERTQFNDARYENEMTDIYERNAYQPPQTVEAYAMHGKRVIREPYHTRYDEQMTNARSTPPMDQYGQRTMQRKENYEMMYAQRDMDTYAAPERPNRYRPMFHAQTDYERRAFPHGEPYERMDGKYPDVHPHQRQHQNRTRLYPDDAAGHIVEPAYEVVAGGGDGGVRQTHDVPQGAYGAHAYPYQRKRYRYNSSERREYRTHFNAGMGASEEPFQTQRKDGSFVLPPHFRSPRDAASWIFDYGLKEAQPHAMLIEEWQRKCVFVLDLSNMVDLCKSLNALAKLSKKVSYHIISEFSASWFRNAINCIQTFQGRNLANSLWALANLRQKVPRDFMRAWMSQAIRIMPTFKSQELANSLDALAKLAYPPSTDFMKAWTSQSLRIMDTFNSQDLSNSVYAFATLRQQPSRSFMEAWIARALHEIGTFNSQDLSSTMWAFATLLHKPHPKFVDAWVMRATQHIKALNHQALANSLWALAKLDIHPTPEFLDAWMQSSVEQMSSFNSQELANCIWAYSELQFIPSKDFLDVWFERALVQMPNFNSQDLSNSLYAFAIMKLSPSRDFLKAWTTRAMMQIHTFNTQELANSLWAYATSGKVVSFEFTNAWTKKALDLIGSFSSQELANSLWAFATWRLRPSQDFFDAWMSRAMDHIKTFNSQELANSLWAMACLSEKPDKELSQLWSAHALSMLETSNTQNLVNSLWALSVLFHDTLIDESSLFLVDWMYETFTRSIAHGSDMNSSECHQLYLAYKAMLSSKSPLDVQQREQLRQQYDKDIEELLNKHRDYWKAQSSSASLLEEKVQSQLNSVEPGQWTRSFWCDALGSSVDFANESKRAVIQVDGPHHFIMESNGLEIQRSEDKLQDNLLYDAGWNIKRLSYKVVDRNEIPADLHIFKSSPVLHI